MRWSLAWVAVLSAVSGCCETGANRYDPFSIYGPRLVPPPATGTLGQPPGAYYQVPAVPISPPPANSGQQLLPVPSLNGQPPAGAAQVPRPSGHWTAADTQMANSQGPASRNSQVVQAGGILSPSDRLPWRIPDTARGRVQPAGAVAPIQMPSHPQRQPAVFGQPPPRPFGRQGLTEITELPRPVEPRVYGIPSAAVFPQVPGDPMIDAVSYGQPMVDYDLIDQAIAYADDVDPNWDGSGYTPVYSDQPGGYVQSPASHGRQVISTSIRSDAWRQRR